MYLKGGDVILPENFIPKKLEKSFETMGMDLKQRKLNKTEWNNTQVPVSQDERRILKLICDGYHDVSLKMNVNQSLSQVIKLDMTPEMEAYLYERYFSGDVKKKKIWKR